MKFSENITRRVRLWIDNEQAWYQMALEWAEECFEYPTERRVETIGRRKAALYDLSDRMEEYFTEHWGDCASGPVPSEVLTTALQYIDWDEIAERYISQVEEEREESEDSNGSDSWDRFASNLGTLRR